MINYTLLVASLDVRMDSPTPYKSEKTPKVWYASFHGAACGMSFECALKLCCDQA